MKVEELEAEAMNTENMKDKQTLTKEEDLQKLCDSVREYVCRHNWEACGKIIPRYMELYPDSAIPHNLMGIVLEKRGNHVDAMKHFRAASALEACYEPANYNMECFASFEKIRSFEAAYDREDYRRMSKRNPLHWTSF